MREFKDVTILVVDDEESLRKAIVFDFKRKGFQVLEAGNGTEAFEIITKNKIDLVLSDVRMPGGDGVELLDKIKTLHPDLPIVMFITGFADLSSEEAYDKGADAVFAKPFDRKTLMAAVLKAVSTKDEAWSARRFERNEVDFEIELKFPELNLSAEGQVLNLGRGGMFVALSENFPMVNAKTSFSIQISQGDIHSIVGEGVVRWIRTQHSESCRQGCGIEFEFLDDGCRNSIIELIAKSKKRAFIPKS